MFNNYIINMDLSQFGKPLFGVELFQNMQEDFGNTEHFSVSAGFTKIEDKIKVTLGWFADRPYASSATRSHNNTSKSFEKAKPVDVGDLYIQRFGNNNKEYWDELYELAKNNKQAMVDGIIFTLDTSEKKDIRTNDGETIRYRSFKKCEDSFKTYFKQRDKNTYAAYYNGLMWMKIHLLFLEIACGVEDYPLEEKM